MNVFIISLEPIETRYTAQWHTGIPALLEREASARGLDVKVQNVDGVQVDSTVTSGAFLNFTATNIWKNTQINVMAEKFAAGEVKAGDKVLFTDAWHPGIIQIKYMSELLDIPVEIHSMWHAGSYDPHDFLGRKIANKAWSFSFERSVFFASNYNYFATEFHINLFKSTILKDTTEHLDSIVRAGQPHDHLMEVLAPFTGVEKKRQIIFPHRVSVEKQPEIFRDLAQSMTDVKFVIAQDRKLSKDEYHALLAESMICFSANQQETLGISSMEAALVGTFPFVPQRLSYTEMYTMCYPSDWTTDWDHYNEHKQDIIRYLRNLLDNFSNYKDSISQQRDRLVVDYLTSGPMVAKLLAS